MRALWACALCALLMALVVVAGGCERRSDATPPAAEAPSARVVVTAGFGAEVLLDGRVAPGGAVLDGLRALTPVKTAYGGGFVAEILGRGTDPGAKEAWFYWVDGVLANRGADQVRLADGEEVWWDHHRWGGAVADPWAVVGAWPLPFTRAPAVATDGPLAGALDAAGARTTGGPGGPWRVIVGTDADLRRRDAAWARAAGDPGGDGLTATLRDGRVLLLDPDGERLRPEPGASAIAVAFPSGTDPADGVVMAVVGTRAGAADAAAAACAARPEVLRNRLAVAFDASGSPLRAAGRGGP
ncbi:MAG: DUF4430 domain-containing protein [Thermoleophilia bacterium]|nr:DUF4430 domain-containing protein [Thermoleophilia bacterium]